MFFIEPVGKLELTLVIIVYDFISIDDVELTGRRFF
jgi:hypothetical protein